MKLPIYLDHHATTPVDAEVFAAMQPYFSEVFGNATSGQHSFGWAAKNAVESAREKVADLLKGSAREIIFTSGATESIHLAILGFLEAQEIKVQHIITAVTEHKCVLEVCTRAALLGHELTVLPVDKFGQVSRAQVETAIRPNTTLVSLMHGNNEIGTLHPIQEIGELCRERGLTFHVDAAQTVGKIPIDVIQMKIDLLSISAHKLYGPKGVGALYVRHTSPRVRLHPYLLGGGQEKGLRGGTHNVPGIVGLGKACEICAEVMASESQRLKEFRDHMIQAIQAAIPKAILNGHPTARLPHNVSITIPGVSLEHLLLGMKDIAYSSASACSSGAGSSSHVLLAIGQADDPNSSTLRFGLGRKTTREEVDYTIAQLISTVANAAQKSIPYTFTPKGAQAPL